MIDSFLPTNTKEPKVLILGSIPSVTSLEKQEYYGFKHNRFWKIMSLFFECEFDSYEEKLKCIDEHNIMLWDVIARCNREGSLDSKIRNVECNDISSLLSKHKTIDVILCNGKKSYDLYQKYFSYLDIEVIALPSTSNANRSIKEDVLIKQWMDTLNQYG